MDHKDLHKVTEDILDNYDDAIAVVLVVVRKERLPVVSMATYGMGEAKDLILDACIQSLKIAKGSEPTSSNIQTSE